MLDSQNPYMTLSALAKEFGMDKSNLRKYILRKGLSFIQVRAAEARGQLVLALTLEATEELRTIREREGFGKVKQINGNDHGYFYIIQPVPGLDPQRIKLGYAQSVMGRLATFRTISPTAQVIKEWPCKRSWESTVRDSITQQDCESVGNSQEVFRCTDLSALVKRCDTIFSLMPSID